MHTRTHAGSGMHTHTLHPPAVLKRPTLSYPEPGPSLRQGWGWKEPCQSLPVLCPQGAKAGTWSGGPVLVPHIPASTRPATLCSSPAGAGDARYCRIYEHPDLPAWLLLAGSRGPLCSGQSY